MIRISGKQKNDLKANIELLCKLPGVSGSENSVAKAVLKILSHYTADIYEDTLGNIHANISCGKKNAKKVLLDAHIDEIGLMVTKVNDGGFLHFCDIGGVDPRILPGALVRVCGKNDIDGVVAVKPPHIQTEDEQKKAIPLNELVIDTGLKNANEVISVGDTITFISDIVSTGRAISGKTLDDRCGLCTLVLALDLALEKHLNVDIELMASVQEEVGTRGAKTGGFISKPDIAIVVDVGHAKTPDAMPDVRTFEFGGGPMIGVGPNMKKDISDSLISIAKNQKIPFQIEVMGWNSGTNAWALQIVGDGIPCGLVSIPLRYMHTTVETVDINDMVNTAKLICAYLLSFGGEVN